VLLWGALCASCMQNGPSSDSPARTAFRDTIVSSARNDIPCPVGDIGVRWTLRTVAAEGCGVRVNYVLQDDGRLAPDERALVLVSRVAIRQ
jgi:hypothetical protein